MFEAVKLGLRIKNDAYDSEIKNLIEACLIDLNLAGYNMEKSEDPLIINAATLYCKAHFGFYDDSDKYAQMYNQLKIAIGNSSEYGDVD